MTSSFGITPQRQIRDLVAQPAKPEQPAAPAKPEYTPQQLGGQLMYSASYQPGNTAETIKSIQDFLSDQGAFGKISELAFNNYKQQKYEEANRLLQQEATALRDSLENAKETQQLLKSGDQNLANQNRLSNPWVNFFYYNTKATNVGKQTAVDLATWGEQQASKLAEIDNPAERAALISAKVDDLLKPYSDIPSAFRSAKIDPLVSSALLDVKKKVNNESFERKKLIDVQTTKTIFEGDIRLGASFKKGGRGTPAATVFAEQSIQSAYHKAYNYYVVNRGYSEKEFHQVLFEIIPNLFVDANNDRVTDLAENFSYLNYVQAWGNIKTTDGQSILDLFNGKQTFRDALKAGALASVTAQEKFDGSVERGITRGQREFQRQQAAESENFYLQNPEPSDNQIDNQRRKETARLNNLANSGQLPEGMYRKDIKELVEKIYPYYSEDLSPTTKAYLQAEVDNEIANGNTEASGDLAARIKGTSVEAYAIGAFAKAKRDADNPAIKATKKGILSGLLDGLRQNFYDKDPDLQNLAGQKDTRDTKKRLTTAAADLAKQRLAVEGARYINNKLYEARQKGKDINDPAVQLEILNEAKQYFYSQPQYSDVDNYYSLKAGKDLGRPNLKGPIVGSSKQRPDGSWEININDTDNRATWASIARSTFKNATQVRNYLDSEFVLKPAELTELNYALASGRYDKLSVGTRRSLANIEQGFNNKVSIAEIIQKQSQRYGLPQRPEYVERAKEIARRSKAPVAGTGTSPRNELLYVYNMQHSHSLNRAIDFETNRGNASQTANPIPSPMSGKVIFTGFVEGYGNTVVIQADSNGPGYYAGERLLLAHAARLTVQQGMRVTRGQPVLIAGDKSRVNSVAGRSTTGRGTPGHIHSQLFQKGDAVFPAQKDQHEQWRQADFFRKAFYPLYRSIDDPSKRR